MLLLRILLCSLIVFLTNNLLLAQTHSQQEIDKVIATLPPCPKPSDDNFEKICEYMDTKDHKEITKLLRDLACINDNDSQLVKKAKMQKMLTTFSADLYCTGEGFKQSVGKGDFLKFAIYRDYPVLIDHLVVHYQFNLNYLHPSDGNETLLDYLKEEIDLFIKIKNSEKKVKELRSIYAQLRAYGAKHFSEL